MWGKAGRFFVNGEKVHFGANFTLSPVLTLPHPFYLQCVGEVHMLGQIVGEIVEGEPPDHFAAEGTSDRLRDILPRQAVLHRTVGFFYRLVLKGKRREILLADHGPRIRSMAVSGGRTF